MSPPGSVALLDALHDSPAPAIPLRALVVATDGSADADSACEVAARLAARHNAAVQVVSVCESVTPVAGPADFSPMMLVSPVGWAVSAALLDARLGDVRDQLLRTAGPDMAWPVAITAGAVGPSVASLAGANNADMVIAGRGRHGAIARLLAEEHVRSLLRSTAMPVLAVDPALHTLPKRAVIAIDFSEDSLRAARAALWVLDESATVYLVHAQLEPPVTLPRPHRWMQLGDEAVRMALTKFRTLLAAPASMTVECTPLRGHHPGTVLERFVRGARADLVVTGAHGTGFFSRLVLGSTATHLLRSAPCSVLSVPPSPGHRGQLPKRTFAHSLPVARRPGVIAEFARLYTGARVTATTLRRSHDPAGRGVTGHLLGLEAAATDTIAFEIGTAAGTRSERIRDVFGVAVTVDDEGRERGLRIDHADGITFISDIT